MLKQVRANAEVATTPFILLTAKSDEEFETQLIGTRVVRRLGRRFLRSLSMTDLAPNTLRCQNHFLGG